jgi:hypothetical protein
MLAWAEFDGDRREVSAQGYASASVEQLVGVSWDQNRQLAHQREDTKDLGLRSVSLDEKDQPR